MSKINNLSRVLNSGIVAIIRSDDGSRLAEEALAIGASLARRGGAPLHLVSAIAPVLEAVRREFPDLAERETQDEIATRMATSSRWRRSFARPVRERSPCRS